MGERGGACSHNLHETVQVLGLVRVLFGSLVDLSHSITVLGAFSASLKSVNVDSRAVGKGLPDKRIRAVPEQNPQVLRQDPGAFDLMCRFNLLLELAFQRGRIGGVGTLGRVRLARAFLLERNVVYRVGHSCTFGHGCSICKSPLVFQGARGTLQCTHYRIREPNSLLHRPLGLLGYGNRRRPPCRSLLHRREPVDSKGKDHRRNGRIGWLRGATFVSASHGASKGNSTHYSPS